MLLYAAIGAFGLLFLLSMLFLGDLFHADHDVHVEVGGHAGVEHGDGPSIFSVRIIGVSHRLRRRRYRRPLLWAVASGRVRRRRAAGVVMAALVYQFARLLYSQQASSELRMASLVGKIAEVSVGIPAGGVGQVTLTVGGERSSTSRVPPGSCPAAVRKSSSRPSWRRINRGGRQRAPQED